MINVSLGSLYVRWYKCSVLEMSGGLGNGRVIYMYIYTGKG